MDIILSSKSRSVNHMIKSRSLNEKQRNKWDDTKVENNEIIFKIFYWPHKLKTFIINFQINFLKKIIYNVFITIKEISIFNPFTY